MLTASDGIIEKQIEDVSAGEVFSINRKARKLILKNIDPGANIIAHVLLATELPGEEVMMPYRDYANRFVTVWGEVGPEEVTPGKMTPFQEFDRVKAKIGEDVGTVVIVQNSKPPDEDYIVLWDNPVAGKWMTEVHPTEIAHLGSKASGKLLELAKEAKVFAKEQEKSHDQKYEDKTRQVVQEELSKRTAQREEFKIKWEQEQRRVAYDLAQKVISKYAPDFRAIVQSGVMAVTAGENNYEIDLIAEIVDGYMDTIMSKVASMVSIPEERIAVAVEVMNTLAKSMADEYLLTREGFIRNRGGKWFVYSKRGNSIGGPFDKKSKAVGHIRHAEWRKRHGMEDTI